MHSKPNLKKNIRICISLFYKDNKYFQDYPSTFSTLSSTRTQPNQVSYHYEWVHPISSSFKSINMYFSLFSDNRHRQIVSEANKIEVSLKGVKKFFGYDRKLKKERIQKKRKLFLEHTSISQEVQGNQSYKIDTSKVKDKVHREIRGAKWENSKFVVEKAYMLVFLEKRQQMLSRSDLINFDYNIFVFITKKMQMRDDFISRTIKTEKLFSFTPGLCCYANIQVTKKIEKSGQDSKIKITNNVCKENDSCLVKITEIKFGNRVIYIEDSYCFKPSTQKDYQLNGKTSSTPANSSDGSQNNNSTNDNGNSKIQFTTRKKKLIFKKKNVGQSSGYKIQKRNTKNIAKNFCKAFMTYLQQVRQSLTLAKMRELIESYKFNNKVIEKMATDSLINHHFKRFLDTKAEEWIQSSKIHDKQIHMQAIKLYLQLIQSGLKKIGDLDDLFNSESKSNYQSDQPYEGSDEDNCRESSQK